MITGRTIYEEIKGLVEEQEELARALEALEDSVGRNSVPYQRVNAIREESQKTLSEAMTAQYQVPTKLKSKSKADPFDF